MTTPAPAVAASITTYTAHTSYITAAEFQNSPTGVELDNLEANGSTDAQAEALNVMIERASSWADAYTFQTLAATVDTAYGRARVRSNGTIRFPLPYKPVLAVLGISLGNRPSQMMPLGSLADAVIQGRGSVEFYAYGTLGSGFNTPGASTLSNPLVQVSYVNGFPNALLTAASAAGASTLTVSSPLGIYPGTSLTVYDGASTESVMVGPGYTPGGNALTLAAPLRYAHAVGASASALPPKVKQAVILLTASMLETAGNDAITLSAMVDPSGYSSAKGASSDNMSIARSLLDEFRRVW